jgi:hypothetical protein
VRVATDPGCAVEPFGRMTPEEPGTAPMEWEPITAITVVDVGLGIVGG